jgi:membrane-associated protease RseP (regulator of RpoE activity)
MSFEPINKSFEPISKSSIEPPSFELEDARGKPESAHFGGRWALPVVLIILTFLSTTFAGAAMEGVNFFDTWNFAAGIRFSGPLMAILLAHEFGHYIAANRHGVPASPPYFIPVPFFMLGTMGAVITMRSSIKRRDALLDIGAAGPLAGLAIAIPVLIYGLAESPVEVLPSGTTYLQEGYSVLYAALLYLIKGPIPPGHDIMLSQTALAGWAGLFITMINLLPIGQLDGGHIAYALFGPKQAAISKVMRALLPVAAVSTGLVYSFFSYAEGKRGHAVWDELTTGLHWLVWWALLALLQRTSGGIEHPPTEPGALSPLRRRVAMVALGFFFLLVMASPMREVAAP